MNKRAFVILSLIVAAVLLASCVTSPPPETVAPASSPAASTAPAPTASAPPATPAPTATSTGTPAPVATTEAPSSDPEVSDIVSPSDVRDAYITGLSMRMDGQTDIIFDFVTWLTGDAATAQYLLDNPGATDSDMEDAGLYEVGYIRNVSHVTHTYHTGPDTKYFLPSADNTAVNVEVTYDQFRDKMFPAVEDGVDAYLTFVRINVDGDTLVRVEWLYLP